MNQQKENPEYRKSEIRSQIKELSRLLSMLPSDESVEMHEPVTQKEMEFSVWLENVRDSFLKLSVLIGDELDIAIGETNLNSGNVKNNKS